LPWLAREHAAGRLGPAVGKIALPLSACAAAGAGALWPWSEKLLALFGEGFVAAAASLRWLLLAVVAVYVGSPLLTGVVAAGRSKAVMTSAAIGLAVNLVGNAWLVPRSGIEGAAIATLATEVSVVLTAGLILVRMGAAPVRGRAWLAWLALAPLFFLVRYASERLEAGGPW
jgi:O-antigen/teichoic acid export membrane protein